ncbi:MAG: alpha/beta fold hydrolase [Chitinophagaceae bacterium]
MFRNEIPFKGQTVFYGTTGEGPVVMLVHGFGEDHHIWKETIQQLSKNFTVVFPDVPGTGHSPMNPSLSSIEDYAEAIHAIVAHENITSLAMIGHSMGGYITLAFAERYPDLLSGFGLFHSTALADGEEKVEARRKGIRFIENNGAAAFLKQSTPNLFTPEYRELHPEMVQQILEYGKTFTNAALIQYYESMIARPDRTEVLKKATVPVLFILGKKDLAVSFTDTLPQTYLPAVSYLEILEASAHMGMFEEKEKCMAILEKFLLEIAVYKE